MLSQTDLQSMSTMTFCCSECKWGLFTVSIRPPIDLPAQCLPQRCSIRQCDFGRNLSFRHFPKLDLWISAPALSNGATLNVGRVRARSKVANPWPANCLPFGLAARRNTRRLSQQSQATRRDSRRRFESRAQLSHADPNAIMPQGLRACR